SRGVEQPVIVGHSWGTLVALAFAIRTSPIRRSCAAIWVLLADLSPGCTDGGARRHPDAGRYPALHHLAGLRLAHDVGHQARDVRAGAGRGKVLGGVLHCYGLAAIADPGDMRRWSPHGPDHDE